VARQEATSAPTPAETAELAGAPPLYTLREIARNLGVSKSTLWRMVQAGRIPYFKVGKQLRFDILAVRAALAPHT
jgi:excisionase family DNA binding protein